MTKRRGISAVIVIVAVLVILLGVIIFPILLVGNYLGGKLDKATGGALASGVCATVKAPYSEIFRKAGAKFGVQPAVIGAIFVGEHRSIKDSSYQNWPDPAGPWATSPAGANGPFQFINSTWQFYQQDGDGDGDKDVQDLTDAAFGAAAFLAKIGAGNNATGEEAIRNAASRYNSGKPWAEGQNITETSNYVTNLVLPAFQSFYCPVGSTSIAGTFDPTGTGTNGVPIYRQGDPRYANIQLVPGNKTFSYWGCCPTAAAMVMRYYGAAVDPIIIGKITAANFYEPGQGTAHGTAWLRAIGSPYGLNSQRQIDVGGGQNWDQVIALLRDKKPLIARGDSGATGKNVAPYTAGGHCIVLTGYDPATTMVSVNNPTESLGDGPFPLEHLKRYTTLVYYLGR